MREEVTKFLKYFSTMINIARYDATHGKRLKILTPKQFLQRLPIAFAQVKLGNISENLLKEYIICIEQKKLLKKV